MSPPYNVNGGVYTKAKQEQLICYSSNILFQIP